jgi:RTX calcium-binding nonapeptide repeat (4 copies)
MNHGRFIRRSWLASLLTMAALVASAAWAAKPSHAAVTLGSDLATAPGPGLICLPAEGTRGCLFVNDVIPGRALVSPFDGVIVRWRVRVAAGTQAQPIRIRVVRRFDGNRFTVISSALEDIPAGAGTHTFAARLPILSGDEVAGESAANVNIGWLAGVAGANVFIYLPSPADGASTDPPFSSFPNNELTLNAVVEPDCDNDAFGDETQDQNLSSCTPGTTPTGVAPTLPSGAPATCKGKPATIVGTNGSDTRTASQGRDVIVALGGNDTLSGLGGNDLICGGKGKDNLNGGKGKDKLYGQKGKDKLRGKAGKDLCVGGKSNDSASKCEVEKSI